MAIEVFDGMVSGMVLWPETFLMKICMVSSSDEDELILEMLDVRCMAAGERVVGGDKGAGDLMTEEVALGRALSGRRAISEGPESGSKVAG